MTLIEMQTRSASVLTESLTVLYELTAGNLYAFYKADIHAYAMVLQNINRELCRRLRRADISIVELAAKSSKPGNSTRRRPPGHLCSTVNLGGCKPRSITRSLWEFPELGGQPLRLFLGAMSEIAPDRHSASSNILHRPLTRKRPRQEKGLRVRGREPRLAL